jgi:hypothetical protein
VELGGRKGVANAPPKFFPPTNIFFLVGGALELKRGNKKEIFSKLFGWCKVEKMKNLCCTGCRMEACEFLMPMVVLSSLPVFLANLRLWSRCLLQAEFSTSQLVTTAPKCLVPQAYTDMLWYLNILI